jgi:hypothetical protein
MNQKEIEINIGEISNMNFFLSLQNKFGKTKPSISSPG